MKTQATFRRYSPGQLLLLPPDMATWLPEGHLVYFIRDVVGQLDLSAIYASYDGSKGGYPPYHPEMMVALVIYAYCVGMPSSRKIEKATHELIPHREVRYQTIRVFKEQPTDRKNHLGTPTDS